MKHSSYFNSNFGISRIITDYIVSHSFEHLPKGSTSQELDQDELFSVEMRQGSYVFIRGHNAEGRYYDVPQFLQLILIDF